MDAAETSEIRPQSNSQKPPLFVKDDSGRTVFYPEGPHRGGYAVPDAQCEQSLRRAVQRYRDVGTSLSIVISVLGGAPVMFCFYMLVNSHFAWATDLLIIFVAAIFVIDRRILSFQISTPLRDLERVPPILKSHLRSGVIAFFVGYPVATELALYLYNARLQALPHSSTFISFYMDVSFPVGVCYLGSGMLVSYISAAGRTPPPMSGAKLTFGTFFSGLFAVVTLIWSASLLLHPAPSLVLTPTELVCSSEWRYAWHDIAGMRLVHTGGRGPNDYVSLTLDDKAFASVPRQSTRPPICKISLLNAPVQTVYDTIHNEWRSRTTLIER